MADILEFSKAKESVSFKSSELLDKFIEKYNLSKNNTVIANGIKVQKDKDAIEKYDRYLYDGNNYTIHSNVLIGTSYKEDAKIAVSDKDIVQVITEAETEKIDADNKKALSKSKSLYKLSKSDIANTKKSIYKAETIESNSESGTGSFNKVTTLFYDKNNTVSGLNINAEEINKNDKLKSIIYSVFNTKDDFIKGSSTVFAIINNMPVDINNCKQFEEVYLKEFSSDKMVMISSNIDDTGNHIDYEIKEENDGRYIYVYFRNFEAGEVIRYHKYTLMSDNTVRINSIKMDGIEIVYEYLSDGKIKYTITHQFPEDKFVRVTGISNNIIDNLSVIDLIRISENQFQMPVILNSIMQDKLQFEKMTIFQNELLNITINIDELYSYNYNRNEYGMLKSIDIESINNDDLTILSKINSTEVYINGDKFELFESLTSRDPFRTDCDQYNAKVFNKEGKLMDDICIYF